MPLRNEMRSGIEYESFQRKLVTIKVPRHLCGALIFPSIKKIKLRFDFQCACQTNFAPTFSQREFQFSIFCLVA